MEHFNGKKVLDVKTSQFNILYDITKPVFSIFVDGKEIDPIYRVNDLKKAIEDRIFLGLLDTYGGKKIKVEKVKFS